VISRGFRGAWRGSGGSVLGARRTARVRDAPGGAEGFVRGRVLAYAGAGGFA
jgi:hypothetical protein